MSRLDPWRLPRLAALIAAMLMLAAGARAQRPAPPAARPVFRTGTSAVLLDVVVRDKKGRPVIDLRQDEVTVLEDGEPVEVQAFGLVRGASPTASLREAATGQPDPLRRVTLVTIVFDHLSQNGRDIARRAALEFLGIDRPADQWVSIYRLDNRLLRTQPFTRSLAEIRAGVQAATQMGARESPDTLLGGRSFDFEQDARAAEASVRQIGGGGGATVDTPAIGAAAGDAAMTAVLERMAVMIDRAELEQRGQSSLYPLMALIKAHGALEGRKALLYFSEGLIVPPNLEEAFRATVSEANRANVSIYAIDARGLDPTRSLDSARIALERSARSSQRQMVTRGSDPVTIEDVMNSENAEGALRKDTQATLQLLAEDTGGFLVANSNNLAARLARVATDLEAYYQVAYTPRLTTYDGNFRRVEVRVKRRGVDVQSRSGYFALPPTDGLPLLPYELPMLAAAAAIPLPRPFDIAATTFRFGTTSRGVQHTVLIEVPLDQLTFDEDRRQKRYTLRFTVMALVKNAAGEVVERLSDSFPLEGPVERVEALRRGRLVFKRQLWLAPGTYTLLAVARDQSSERSSVQSLHVEVPAASAGAPLLSTPAIIRRVEPASDQPDTVEDPFRTDQLRIVPGLGVPISRAANAHVSAYVVVYPVNGAVPALAFEFVRDGAVMGRSSATLPTPDTDGRIKYVASFPTSTFAPGTYTVRAVATLGTRTDHSEQPFTIVP